MISSSTRPRRAIAVAAALLAAMDVAAVSAQAHAADSRSRPELGFRIGQTARADGSWLGRYRIGHQLGYRIQPRKSNAQSAYHPARRVIRAAGAGRVATERSAWVLSTYGRTTDLTTAAAVDVAVNALLNGGKWRLGTAYTAHRTSPTGNGRFIRAYAR